MTDELECSGPRNVSKPEESVANRNLESDLAVMVIQPERRAKVEQRRKISSRHSAIADSDLVSLKRYQRW
jgi:hypothetical protein